MKATAEAHPNLALVKYWAKKKGLSPRLNVPAADSVGVTLRGVENSLKTLTTVEFRESFEENRAILLTGDGEEELDEERILKVVDPLRKRAGVDLNFKVVSRNFFPTEAGLASSSSAFSALTWATLKALDLDLSRKEASTYARLGSGSAARSLFGRYVYWHSTEEPADSFAEPLNTDLDLKVVIALVSEEEKEFDSKLGHEAAWKSPLTNKFVKETKKQAEKLVKSIEAKDFNSVGRIAEENFKLMHSVITTSLGFVYLEPKSLKVIKVIKEMRRKGTECYYSLDAGPNVFCICKPKAVDEVNEVLEKKGLKTIITEPGEGVKLIEEHLF